MPVSLSVCLYVTANLGIYTDRRQMMGTNGISRVCDHLKKGIFDKNALFKSYDIIYILRQALLCIYVDGRFSVR